VPESELRGSAPYSLDVMPRDGDCSSRLVESGLGFEVEGVSTSLTIASELVVSQNGGRLWRSGVELRFHDNTSIT